MGCALGTQSANPKCFLDIAVEDKIIGRLVIVLRIDVVPKTTQDKLNTVRSNTTQEDKLRMQQRSSASIESKTESAARLALHFERQQLTITSDNGPLGRFPNVFHPCGCQNSASAMIRIHVHLLHLFTSASILESIENPADFLIF
ncbi:hypothetical protein O6H91_12G026300 [Diphasiastrum complanatum]|uniref:Uncharacterized protein n=1 Tax=Diphasiastrum complanatum TaxID=34168 RepID=A0ACC2BZT7_DIPCM|nr:hypothetical protein O6H91_12G026300 [Diphasiastrum complanatum]